MSHPRFEFRTRVAFGDTDASGWMHFPKVFRFVEEAEHAWLRALEIPIFDPRQGGWPRARVECDYRRPLCFEDEIVVVLEVMKIGAASLEWAFQILNAEGEVAAEGRMVTVRVDATGKPEVIPEEIREKLMSGF